MPMGSYGKSGKSKNMSLVDSMFSGGQKKSKKQVATKKNTKSSKVSKKKGK